MVVTVARRAKDGVGVVSFVGRHDVLGERDMRRTLGVRCWDIFLLGLFVLFLKGV